MPSSTTCCEVVGVGTGSVDVGGSSPGVLLERGASLDVGGAGGAGVGVSLLRITHAGSASAASRWSCCSTSL